MANLDAPLGFNPIRNPFGTTIPSDPYEVTASQGVAPGTICYLTDAGTIQAYTGTTLGAKAIIGAAMGSVASGATLRDVEVANHPDQEYEVQSDDNTLTLITDLIGANFAGVNIATVHTTLIQSRGEINGNTGTSINSATAIRPFRGLRFSRAADDDAAQSFNNIVVKVNSFNHIFGAPITVSATLSNTGVL